MEKQIMSQLLSELRQSTPFEIQVGSNPVKDGRNLTNSVTEDVRGFSLMPQYTVRQLKRIERRQTNKITNLVSSSKRKWEITLRW